jgi:hypothetical protein
VGDLGDTIGVEMAIVGLNSNKYKGLNIKGKEAQELMAGYGNLYVPVIIAFVGGGELGGKIPPNYF